MTRKKWVDSLFAIVNPVFRSFADDSIRSCLPREGNSKDCMYLEALARSLCGAAPWLELTEFDDSEEAGLHSECLDNARRALDVVFDSRARSYVPFDKDLQALVETAYLSQAMLRMPTVWRSLDEVLRMRIIEAVRQTRDFKCPENNWLLFQSMREAFLMSVGQPVDTRLLERGIRLFCGIFYCGDGMYGDGRTFAMDYYNSYVIHPMLMDALEVCRAHGHPMARHYDRALARFRRYVEIQERTVGPDGTFPVYGRTLICRLGAFHALAKSVLDGTLPASLSFSQARGAMDALLSRFMDGGNIDRQGFLTIGFCGRQRRFAESYVSSGSPYHMSTFFLPLGLPARHEFWAAPSAPWTAFRAFEGKEFEPDHAFDDMTLRDMVTQSVKRIVYLIKLRYNIR